jgi:uncharacterized MAPEG superfamily protein
MDAPPPAELLLLGLAIVVGIVNLGWAAVMARGQEPRGWAAGARDERIEYTGAAARLQRSFANFIETFPLFAAAVLACAAMDRFGALTLWGSGLYVASRALFVPLYATGVAGVRTVVWIIGLIGLLMVVSAIFL